MTFGITQTDIFLNLTSNRNWNRDADMNGDGYVTQYEFANYIVGEFNGAVDMGSDVIARFWNEFDTNKTGKLGNTDLNNRYALDEAELERLGKQLDYYEKLRDYVNSITNPGVLQGQYLNKWINMVYEELSIAMESYSGDVNDITSYFDTVYNDIKSHITGICYAEQVITTELGNRCPGYNFEDDSVLLNMIYNCCSQNFNTSDVKGLIYKYLNISGFTNVNSSANLSDYGYNNNILNPLQKQHMLNELADAYKNDPLYTKYSQYYHQAFEEYLNGLSGDDFNTNPENDFKGSDIGQRFDKVEELLACKDLTNEEGYTDLYSLLYQKFNNNSVCQALAGNIKDNAAYQSMIDNYINGILNGTIDSVNLSDIANEIITNLTSFGGSVIDAFSFNSLKDFLDINNANGLWQVNKDTRSLAETKTIAIEYCKVLVEYGGYVGLQVYEKFGMDFVSEISKFTDKAELDSKMSALYWSFANVAIDNDLDYNFVEKLVTTTVDSEGNETKTTTYKEVFYNSNDGKYYRTRIKNGMGTYTYTDECQTKNNTTSEVFKNSYLSWWCVDGIEGNEYWKTNSGITVANKGTLDLSMLYLGTTDGIVARLGDSIEYNYTFASGGKTSEVGKIVGTEFKSNGKAADNVCIKVEAKIGNIVISTSQMYFTVKAAEATPPQDDGDDYNPGGEDTTLNLSSLEDKYGKYPINQIYRQNVHMPMYDCWSTKDEGLNGAKEKAINGLNTTIDDIARILKKTFDDAKVDYACNTAKNYYAAFINKITDQMDNGDKACGQTFIGLAFTDANGVNMNDFDTTYWYLQKEYKFESSANGADSQINYYQGETSGYYSHNGIQLSSSWNSYNSYKFYINLGAVLDTIEKFFNNPLS